MLVSLPLLKRLSLVFSRTNIFIATLIIVFPFLQTCISKAKDLAIESGYINTLANIKFFASHINKPFPLTLTFSTVEKAIISTRFTFIISTIRQTK